MAGPYAIKKLSESFFPIEEPAEGQNTIHAQITHVDVYRFLAAVAVHFPISTFLWVKGSLPDLHMLFIRHKLK